MMKIIMAFDSFKGCMSADEACHTAAQAIKEMLLVVSHSISSGQTEYHTEIIECPLSDGGEGLADCVEHMLPVKRVTIKAHDALMNIVDASYVVDKNSKTAYMEMAETCGLDLVPIEKRNPTLTTTYGVGEMIIDALQRGCTGIVMGIGGSATCDGGQGMIKCLRDNNYLDDEGKIVNSKLSKCKLLVASDVTNPLYGRQGAAYIFAPQKGATAEQVILLDKQLRDFARETEKIGLGLRQTHNKLINLSDYPGAGAAGGLGYGLMSYLKAELKSGIDIILDIRDFDSLINDATLIITGEGKSDEQTMMGKVPDGVLLRTKNLTGKKIPVWLLSGCIDNKNGILTDNFDFVMSINDGDTRPLDILMQPSVAKENMKKTIKEIIKGKFNLKPITSDLKPETEQVRTCES